MDVSRDMYVRTTATRAMQGLMDSRKDAVPDMARIASIAFSQAEAMANEAEVRGYSPWDYKGKVG